MPGHRAHARGCSSTPHGSDGPWKIDTYVHGEARTCGRHWSCLTHPGQLCTGKMQQTFLNPENTNYSPAPSKDLWGREGKKAGQLKTWLLPASPGNAATRSRLLRNSSHSYKCCSGRDNVQFLCLPPRRRNTWYSCKGQCKTFNMRHFRWLLASDVIFALISTPILATSCTIPWKH